MAAKKPAAPKAKMPKMPPMPSGNPPLPALMKKMMAKGKKA